MFQEASECEALAKFELFKQVRRRRSCEHRGGMPVGESRSRIAQRGAAGMRGLRREPSCADGQPRAVSEPSRGHLRRRSGRGVSLNAPRPCGSQMLAAQRSRGLAIVPSRAFQNRRHGSFEGERRAAAGGHVGIGRARWAGCFAHSKAAAAHMVDAKFSRARPAGSGVRKRRRRRCAARQGAASGIGAAEWGFGPFARWDEMVAPIVGDRCRWNRPS
jgi:hypothetical protein